MRTIKRIIVKSSWWLWSPLGTTLNGILGGPSETGLEGGYEQRVPDEVGSGKKWTPKPSDVWENRPLVLKAVDYIKAMIGAPIMFVIILTLLLLGYDK